MTPLIDLLSLEKKLCDRIEFLESIIFKDSCLTDEEFEWYTKEYDSAHHELYKCRVEIGKYIRNYKIMAYA